MKLSRTEISLLLDIRAAHKRRRRDAWISFLTVIALFVATYQFELLASLRQSGLLGFAVGATAVYLIHVYFAIRPEDKLISLLQRYVHCDAEAVKQVAQATETNGTAA
jgi:hypothetical protein